MAIHFSCTQCGKCCHDLRLTLSAEEAAVWVGNGHTVQVLSEALPVVPGAADADDPGIVRSFAAMSGEMPIRIAATLVAYHEGACPHLLLDMRCGNYAARPRICRIYPLDRLAGMRFETRGKVCPPEAWEERHPPLIDDARIFDPEAVAVLAQHREIARRDVPLMAALCRKLGIGAAAFAGEGLAVHTPEPAALLDALHELPCGLAAPDGPASWTIVTNRAATFAMLAGAGCDAGMVTRGTGYLGSFPDEPGDMSG
ncbi:MAG: YkgJ family cysteine cluster protein [Novosphingobium sp.]|nr:YkgJ family cysteine cluster protein [Novosphingobium sp.]